MTTWNLKQKQKAMSVLQQLKNEFFAAPPPTDVNDSFVVMLKEVLTKVENRDAEFEWKFFSKILSKMNSSQKLTKNLQFLSTKKFSTEICCTVSFCFSTGLVKSWIANLRDLLGCCAIVMLTRSHTRLTTTKQPTVREKRSYLCTTC